MAAFYTHRFPIQPRVTRKIHCLASFYHGLLVGSQVYKGLARSGRAIIRPLGAWNALNAAEGVARHGDAVRFDEGLFAKSAYHLRSRVASLTPARRI